MENERVISGHLPDGLSEEQAAAMLAQGLGNKTLEHSTRSVQRIFRDNIFTFFNLINGILAVIVLLVSFYDAKYLKNMLFLGVVVANTLINAIQEIRAKKTVDKLTILTEPKAVVRRSGKEWIISVEELLPGDIMKIQTGQQISVDGRVIESQGLEVDESMLSGESQPVRKASDQEVLSGSVVMSGMGYVEVTKVAQETFAARITLEAKQEKRATSPLIRSLNKILKYISIIMFPLGIAIMFNVYMSESREVFLRGMVSTVGLLVSMLPEGLILLTSVALSVAVIRMGRKKALVQNVPSVETLARVDVLCLDKTGTITTGEMSLVGLIEAKGSSYLLGAKDEADLFKSLYPDALALDQFPDRLWRALSSFCSVFQDGNATQKAISEVFYQRDLPHWKVRGSIPFSSRRKWSAACFEDQGSWYLGAAEMLLTDPQREALQETMEKVTSQGFRVLVLCHSNRLIDVEAEAVAPEDLSLEALLVIADQLRPDVGRTLGFFDRQGVDIKIISGDHPKTLEAIAKRAGVKDYQRVVDMSQYGEEEDFGQLAQEKKLFGRVSPFQKRALLRSLQAQGHIVAMTGDGVNDVLALKEADCGVAMASGSEAARAAADIVLLDNQMSLMVDAVDEGRRVINYIQRVASLFLIKTTYAILFALSILPLKIHYPILPIQGTLINTVTVGFPSFILALKPNRERVMGRFLANVMPLAWPAGFAAAIMLIILQLLQKYFQIPQESMSTFAMLALVTVGLKALFSVSRPFDLIKKILFVSCVTIALVAILFFSKFFMIVLPESLNWVLFMLMPLLALGITEGFYRLSRTYTVRQILRKLWGKSREDILREEEDKLRAKTLMGRLKGRVQARRIRRSERKKPVVKEPCYENKENKRKRIDREKRYLRVSSSDSKSS